MQVREETEATLPRRSCENRNWVQTSELFVPRSLRRPTRPEASPAGADGTDTDTALGRAAREEAAANRAAS